MDPVALASAFLTHYYQQFGANRSALAALYRPESMLTMTGTKHQGVDAIVSQLSALPKCQLTPVTYDCQPSLGTGVIVLVNGNLTLENGVVSKYCETFNIQPVPGVQGQFFIYNHIFRVQQ